MRLLLRAFETLSRQILAVIAYAAAVAALTALYMAASHLLVPAAAPEAVRPPLVAVEEIALDLALAAAGAALYAVTFAHIGAGIAGTIWRFGRPLAALRRFMPLWFILFLVQLGLMRVIARLAQDGADSAVTGLAWLFVVYSAVLVPLGAALMYRGAPGREELADTLAPFGRHLGETLPIFLLGFLGQMLLLAIQPPQDAAFAQRFLALVPLQVLMSLIDLVLFAWVFHVLRYDQTTHAPDGDIEL